MRASIFAGEIIAMLAATGVTAVEETGYNPGCFFQSKTVIIPHDDKKFRGGEDSADSSDYVLTVADGVGGWAEQGINPGLFSTELTASVIGISGEEPEQSAYELAYTACQHAATLFEGSATLVIIRLLEGLKIEGANLGDSGYALFHVNKDDTIEMYFRSPSQQKTHNFPFQCGSTGDSPEEAEYFLNEDVREGDVVLVFSDGVVDNVYDSGLYHCIEEYLYDGLVVSLSQAADCLARKAYFLGKNNEYRSPWMAEFKHYEDSGIPVLYPAEEGYDFIGGKHDDITITLAQVFSDNGPDDPHRQLAANDTFFTA